MTVMTHSDERARLRSASVPGYGEMRVGDVVSIVPGGRTYRVGELFVGAEGRLIARLWERGGHHSIPMQYPADRLIPVPWSIDWGQVLGYAIWAWLILMGIAYLALMVFGDG